VGGSQAELLETFLRLGYISSDAVQVLKGRAESRGIALIEAALLENLLDLDAKGWLLSERIGIPFLEIDPESVPLSLRDVLPESLARENLVVPISRENDRLTLAVADPFCHEVFSAIEAKTGLRVRLVICPNRTIAAILARFYPDPFQLSAGDLTGGLISGEEVEKWASQGGARRVVEKVLLHAATIGITSIRLFPEGEKALLKGRKEAGSELLLSLPLRFRRLLIDAFAEMAGIAAPPGPVSESIFQLESASGIASFRLSFVRGLSGVEVIVKMLPDQRAVITLDSVGMNQEQIDITRRVLAKVSGLYLLSSPGPEGIATTLFALLRKICRPRTRVVTVEEQFRFRNEGFIQLERRDVDRQFAGEWKRLAESLEPGALMIEHVSDPSGFSDLIHLAQSGTTVLCGIRRFNFDRTLRTLLSLDVDPFILARVVRFVMHQRLVNLLCQECRRPVPAKPTLRMVGERYRDQLEKIVEEASFYIPAGCPRCEGMGFSGKMALVELLPFTPAVENLVASDASLEEKLGLLLQEDFYSAVQSVHDLLRRGMVTFDDVLPFFR
jgi:type II secretory ATPase GspE/PulE/Tfp pilus assembly ATPase PilB-like protein